jgi:hypothetical protein
LSYSYFLFCIHTIVLPVFHALMERSIDLFEKKYSHVLDRTWHMRAYTSPAWNSFLQLGAKYEHMNSWLAL